MAAAELATEPVAVVDFLAEATSLLSGATQQQTELLQSIERAQQEVQYLQVCMCVFAFAHVSVFMLVYGVGIGKLPNKAENRWKMVKKSAIVLYGPV